MARGVVSGVIVGMGVAAGALVAGAKFLPPVDISLPAPDAGEVAVPAGSEFNAERPDLEPVLPEADGRPAGGEAPVVASPTGADQPPEGAEPADTPQASVADGGLTAPSTSAGASPEVSGEESVQTGEIGATPAAPNVDETPAVAEPELAPETGGQAELASVSAGEAAPELPSTEAESTVSSDASAPSQPVSETVVEAEAPAAAPETGDSPGTTTAAASPDAPSVPSTPSVEGGPSLVMPEIGETSGLGQDPLPDVSGGPAAPIGAEPVPALIRFASDFTGSDAAPLMSLVLLDGADAPEPDGLRDFLVPLTVAIDPFSSDAATRMVKYRDLGFEVVVLTPLPEGAAPADVEVAFQEFLRAVPQAVAVLDLPDARLQESRPRAAQVVEILAETGLGLVTYEKGFNSALQIAGTKNVAAATVFRTFDDGARDTGALKRFIDQGAFRAGQAGGVVMVGELRAEVIAAIAEWAVGSRAATISLAPLSAVLRSRQSQ